MSEKIEIKNTVSGSFKYKPEIDLAIEEFEELGIKVLAPEKGWLFVPKFGILTISPESAFRPLPLEQGMTVRQIEDSYLNFLNQAHFLYIVNPAGYVGNSTALEIGFAIARDIPIFAQYPIDTRIELDLYWFSRVSEIPVISISDLVKHIDLVKSEYTEL